jgi:hypothetical protein
MSHIYLIVGCELWHPQRLEVRDRYGRSSIWSIVEVTFSLERIPKEEQQEIQRARGGTRIDTRYNSNEAAPPAATFGTSVLNGAPACVLRVAWHSREKPDTKQIVCTSSIFAGSVVLASTRRVYRPCVRAHSSALN